MPGGEFDLGDVVGGSSAAGTGMPMAMTETIDEDVALPTTMTRKDRKAKLDAARRDEQKADNSVNENERRYGVDKGSINQVVGSVKKELAATLYYSKAKEGKAELPAYINMAYRALGIVGVDLCDLMMNKHIAGAEKLRDTFDSRVTAIYNAMNLEKRGREGIKVLLEADQRMAESYANKIASCENFIAVGNEEIANCQSEIVELEAKARKDTSIDISQEKEYLQREISQIQREIRGNERDIDVAEKEMYSADGRIQTEKKLYDQMNQVYMRCSGVANQLSGRIEGVKVLVKHQKMGEGLVKIVQEMGGALDAAASLSEIEDALGTAMVDILTNIDEQTKNVDEQSMKGSQYQRKFDERSAEYNRERQQMRAAKVKQYATVTYK